MEAKELMLGNWVETELCIRRIAHIEEYRCGTILKPCIFTLQHFSFDKIKGIQLTEQIMLDCGFYRDKRLGRWRHENSSTLIEISDKPFATSASYDGEVCVYATFLHELQNIFHCLEGIELEYKKSD